jgi:hypothetical protein
VKDPSAALDDERCVILGRSGAPIGAVRCGAVRCGALGWQDSVGRSDQALAQSTAANRRNGGVEDVAAQPAAMSRPPCGHFVATIR